MRCGNPVTGSRSQEANRNGEGGKWPGIFFSFSGGGEACWGRRGRTCVCAIISHEAKRDSRKLKKRMGGSGSGRVERT